MQSEQKFIEQTPLPVFVFDLMLLIFQSLSSPVPPFIPSFLLLFPVVVHFLLP